MPLVSRRNVRLGWHASWLAILTGAALTAARASHVRGTAFVVAGAIPAVWGIVVVLDVRGASDHVPYRGLRDDWPPYYRRAQGLTLGVVGVALFIAGLVELFE